MSRQGIEKQTTGAAESVLLERIDAGLQASLEVQPSPAFLPAVRERVAEMKAERDASRRRAWVPALATLAGALIVGHFVRQETQNPVDLVVAPSRPAAPREVPAVPSVEPVIARAPEAAPASISRRVAVPDRGPEVGPDPRQGAEASPLPRVLVPPEDAEVVRRLARRLRGHAARASVMGPDVEEPFDFALKPIEGRQEVVTIDRHIGWETDPGFAEPPSFDRTVEKAGRET